MPGAQLLGPWRFGVRDPAARRLVGGRRTRPRAADRYPSAAPSSAAGTGAGRTSTTGQRSTGLRLDGDGVVLSAAAAARRAGAPPRGRAARRDDRHDPPARRDRSRGPRRRPARPVGRRRSRSRPTAASPLALGAWEIRHRPDRARRAAVEAGGSSRCHDADVTLTGREATISLGGDDMLPHGDPRGRSLTAPAPRPSAPSVAHRIGGTRAASTSRTGAAGIEHPERVQMPTGRSVAGLGGARSDGTGSSAGGGVGRWPSSRDSWRCPWQPS